MWSLHVIVLFVLLAQPFVQAQEPNQNQRGKQHNQNQQESWNELQTEDEDNSEVGNQHEQESATWNSNPKLSGNNPEAATNDYLVGYNRPWYQPSTRNWRANAALNNPMVASNYPASPYHHQSRNPEIRRQGHAQKSYNQNSDDIDSSWSYQHQQQQSRASPEIYRRPFHLNIQSTPAYYPNRQRSIFQRNPNHVGQQSQVHPHPVPLTASYMYQSQAAQSNPNVPDRSPRSWLTNFISSVGEAVAQLSREMQAAKPILNLTTNDFEKIDSHQGAVIVNVVCAAKLGAIAFPQTHLPKKSDIPVSLLFNEANKTVPLESMSQLLNEPFFKNQQNITIYITGLDVDVNRTAYNMSMAYGCRNEQNLMVIDVGMYVRNISEWLTLDTENVGKMIAQVLNSTLPQYKGSSYHLIGHGIAAHVAAHVGHYYYQIAGTKIGRITLLNPAPVCTNQLGSLHFGNADFTDSINTDPNTFGSGLTQTDVSFYPKVAATSKAANNGIEFLLSAVHFYIESVNPGMENNFLGQSPLAAINKQEDNTENNQVPMGYSTPVTARGYYVLDTNEQYPHGNNANPDVVVGCNNENVSDDTN